jgi:energy-coupling factor transporter transmembrane protein EcfT
VVGRTPPKARNLCRTTPTILCLLLFVLLFFLDLLFLLLYVLLLFLHVFLLLLQIFLCFLYVLLLFLYVLLLLLGFVAPTTTQDQRQCQENHSCKNPQAINQLY